MRLIVGTPRRVLSEDSELASRALATLVWAGIAWFDPNAQAWVLGRRRRRRAIERILDELLGPAEVDEVVA